MLEAREITIKYEDRTAVEAISLVLRPGTVTVIVGPNGAGKSTLLRSLNGQLTPSAGSILLNNLPIAQFSRRAIAKQITVVAQEA